MKKIVFILLILLSSSGHAAEVFKCQLESGKTIYQSTLCHSFAKQQAIQIQESDPRKIAEEEAKLKAWKEEFAAREAAKIKAEKEFQAELDRKASVEALQKSADYQQQQAYEAKRQADALEQQRMQSPYLLYPAFPSSGYQAPIYPPHLHHQHDIREQTVTDTHQSGQSDTTPGKDKDDGHAKFIFNWK